MKLLYLLFIFGLIAAALATDEASQDPAPSDENVEVESDRTGRAMGEEDDFSADFDEFIRYFQRGIRRFINRMTNVQERQGGPLGSTIPFIGRLIFQSLSYLGSFLVGALAVPPLLAGNALSLFGLYRPEEPNQLLNAPVLPNFQFNSHTNRISQDQTKNHQVNDLSEALFLLGQKNHQQASHDSPSNAEHLLAQAAGGNSPVEISEIVNDLIRVQSSSRPTSLWDRLTSGLSVFLPQVSRQVGPVGALGSLLFLGTLIGAPYFLSRRQSDAGIFDDYESTGSSEDLVPPPPSYSQSEYEDKNARQRKTKPEATQYQAAYGNTNAYAVPAYSGDQQAYAAAASENNEITANYNAYGPQQGQQGYSPYSYVSRRTGENAKSDTPAETVVAEAA